MTPMIDIVFQLLTFFMIVSNFEDTKADERVKLPKDTLAKPPEVKPKEELVLNIGFERDSTGKRLSNEPVIFYAGDDVPLAQMKERLETEKRLFKAEKGEAIMKEVSVILRADAEVPTGMVQNLIKLCQDVGFTRFSLKATQEEQ
ncbi:MAG: biopolymer transporter ExbD [Planctomycetales bacterium 12-60-4]|nr:MAG: biopolymer transporter ExbD [Planctomycetales bacterium 12-60-4]